MAAASARAAVERLAQQIPHDSWFAAVGKPLTDGEQADAVAYLTSLGFPDCTIAGVADWTAAKAISQAPDWDPRWWEAEERLRGALLAEATNALGEDAVMGALTAVTTAASDVVHGAAAVAAVAAAHGGMADPAFKRVAAGAAGHGDAHPFAVKRRLFAAGRWPLGIVGEAFQLF